MNFFILYRLHAEMRTPSENLKSHRWLTLRVLREGLFRREDRAPSAAGYPAEPPGAAEGRGQRVGAEPGGARATRWAACCRPAPGAAPRRAGPKPRETT